MIFRTSEGLERLLSDKFKIGAAVTAAAGPVGRHATPSTDIEIHAEILTYSAHSNSCFINSSWSCWHRLFAFP